MSPQPSGEVRTIAAEIFGRYGVEFDQARENTRHTHASWLGGGLAVKVAADGVMTQWAREVRLAAALPAGVGYPRVLGHGVVDGHEWLVTELIEADNLEAVWPALSGDQRIRAIRQAWARNTAVHAIHPDGLVPGESKFYPASARATRDGLARLCAEGLVKAADLPALYAILDRHWAGRSTAVNVLNHGDFCTCNALWDGTDVVSLLDFELAIAAPVQVDLNELVKFAYGPPEVPQADPGEAMRDVVAELAAPLLRTSADVDLLLGFSVQLEVWVAQAQLVEPWTDLPPAQWQCFHLLAALADRPGGHYAPLLDRLDIR